MGLFASRRNFRTAQSMKALFKNIGLLLATNCLKRVLTCLAPKDLTVVSKWKITQAINRLISKTSK